MAQLCAGCLSTVRSTVRGMCWQCNRVNDRLRRPAASERYPAEYRRNRKLVLEGDPECHWGCGRPATTADHLIPRAKGGSHDLSNLVPSCAHCNSSRGAGRKV